MSNDDNLKKEVKTFNKAWLDLKQISAFEWYSGQARIEQDYGLWINVLGGWLNKLSPDINAKDMEELDGWINNASILLHNKGDNGDMYNLLNKAERKLYKLEKDIGITNPQKMNDFLSEEKWD